MPRRRTETESPTSARSVGRRAQPGGTEPPAAPGARGLREAPRGGHRRAAGEPSDGATVRAPRRAPEEPAPRGLAGLFRSPGSVLGQLSGIDAPARSLDRLAASAERAADFLDRLDGEVGIHRVARVLDRLDDLAGAAEETHRSIRRIEQTLGRLHEEVAGALDRLAAARPR